MSTQRFTPSKLWWPPLQLPSNCPSSLAISVFVASALPCPTSLAGGSRTPRLPAQPVPLVP
eukprot:scaffold6507_cov215-Prasinococcus_capsulatus_cf.AAC.2